MFIDKSNFIYDDKNEIIGAEFTWKFGFLNTESGCLEIGINPETLAETDLALLNQLNSSKEMNFKLILETGDSLSQNNELINKRVIETKNISNKSERKIVVPDVFSNFRNIQDFPVFKITVEWSDVQKFQFSHDQYTVSIIPANQMAGMPGKNEIWYEFDYQLNDNPINTAIVQAEIKKTPNSFRLFIDDTVFPFFDKGGVISIILTILGLLGVILFFVYLTYFSDKYFVAKGFDENVMNTWKSFFENPDIQNCYDLIKKENQIFKGDNVLERIFFNAILKHIRYKNHWSRFVHVHQTIDDNLLLEAEMKKTIFVNNRLLKWLENLFSLEYFWNIGSIAPMLGLLGTVIGIADAFSQVALNPDLPKEELIQSLSGGINTALYTTIFGLAVGIPMMIFYYWLKFSLDKKVFTITDKFNKFFFLKE